MMAAEPAKTHPDRRLTLQQGGDHELHEYDSRKSQCYQRQQAAQAPDQNHHSGERDGQHPQRQLPLEVEEAIVRSRRPLRRAPQELDAVTRPQPRLAYLRTGLDRRGVTTVAAPGDHRGHQSTALSGCFRRTGRRTRAVVAGVTGDGWVPVTRATTIEVPSARNCSEPAALSRPVGQSRTTPAIVTTAHTLSRAARIRRIVRSTSSWGASAGGPAAFGWVCAIEYSLGRTAFEIWRQRQASGYPRAQPR
jgi:hypothetical protein